MDIVLKEICLDIINDDINSDHFTWLLLNTGINVDGFEWQVANRLLNQGENLKKNEKKLAKIMH